MQEIALQFGRPFKLCSPGEGTVVAFCGRILALGRWNLQMSWCKCPGVPKGQPLGMATDKCISQLSYWETSSLTVNQTLSRFIYRQLAFCMHSIEIFSHAVIKLFMGRRGGLMVSVLVSGSSGLGSSPGRGHCVVFLGKTFYSHSASLRPGV